MALNRRGFTLVEILIAITVLTVGLVSFIAASGMITRMLGSGNRAAGASFYAQERLERLQGLPCALLANGSETRGQGYQLAWTVTSTAAGAARRVELVVTYTSGPGRTRADTMETSVLCVR